MQAVWKYAIPINEDFAVELPEGAVPLTVQMQRGLAFLWMQVDPRARRVLRHFAVIGTGHEYPMDGWRYIGTFQLESGALVFHLYETDGQP